MRLFLAATKQLYEWYFLSACLSVCLSVTPFWLCSHHYIIMKFSGVITKDQGKVHAKGQGQRSKAKATDVTTQLSGFRTVTPVWIYSRKCIWKGCLYEMAAILSQSQCVKYSQHPCHPEGVTQSNKYMKDFELSYRLHRIRHIVSG